LCSPVVVVDVVAPVFEQRLTRLAYVLVSICLGCLELHEHVTDHLGDVSSALERGRGGGGAAGGRELGGDAARVHGGA
jgi:hypothetical protein